MRQESVWLVIIKALTPEMSRWVVVAETRAAAKNRLFKRKDFEAYVNTLDSLTTDDISVLRYRGKIDSIEEGRVSRDFMAK